MPSVTLYKIQQEILNYFKGKEVDQSILNNSSIDDLGIYKSLVINAMEDFMTKVFQHSFMMINGDSIEIVKDYLELYPSKSPLFFRLAEDFPNFIKSEFFISKYQPTNFLAELSLYEWTEVEVNNSPNLEAKTSVNPIHKILRLNFPISKIKALLTEASEDEIMELKNSDVDLETEIVIIFREVESCKTRFFSLTEPSLIVIKGFLESSDDQKVFEKLCSESSLANNSETRTAFQNLINELKKNNILLK